MDLRFLEHLYTASGPVASAYLDTTRAEENAADHIRLRLRSVLDGLQDQGADPLTLEVLEAAAGGGEGIPGPQGEALFAAGGRLLGAFTLSQPPPADRGAWLPVADTVDLVADTDGAVAYAVVAADRAGADVYAYPAGGGLVDERHYTGATLHITKVPSGGWSQRRYQEHTEQVWRLNAENSAREVEEAVEAVGAAAVFIGGDKRAVDLITEHVSERTRGLMVELEGGGRADPDDLRRLRTRVDEGLRRTADVLRAQILVDLPDQAAQGLAVAGADATARALSRGQVGRLVLDPGRAADRDLWALREDRTQVAPDPDGLAGRGDPFAAPAGALALRAAQAQDAAVTVLPRGTDVQDGVAAFLRFETTPATGSEAAAGTV
ncbi:baeRF2 domain-containing protein [Nocardiopsis suaedae]|uniref:Vms1/Ankzf1 family peptidyl-tRNA hydrolase n=1 Tax=Nocardiopsis suaedae TaxID=3018444 RepID=A0ABT4THH3_9ACTN|nr:Vms1/Ankzf1 family peptidyl-tRNA hydrolase [Nocardiopsis suaedae]MDA2804046.1 Vms1/Ankzf1 family peptidyl-tRNA hydrolase [Nocardiopsis suaedae]